MISIKRDSRNNRSITQRRILRIDKTIKRFNVVEEPREKRI